MKALAPDIVLVMPRPGAMKTSVLKGWSVRNVTLDSLLEEEELPPITIVGADSPEELGDFPRMARRLDRQLQESRKPAFLVLAFEQPDGLATEVKVELLKPFARPECVEISEASRDVLRVVENLTAKIRALEERASAPRPSPLDRMKGVMAATQDLRVGRGNLSAKAIAELWGLSLNELAKQLGRTRQAVTKTPDADSLQQDLTPFERIARLRSVLSDDEFRKWLRMPRADLEGQTPLRLSERKQWRVLADLVEDMLAGAPT